MAVKRVLILTAGFGEGHNAAARNLREALAAAGAEAAVHDIFHEAYGWVNRLTARAYLVVINRFPALWNLIFRWLDRSAAVNERIGVFGRAARRLRTLLAEFRPDIVVSTYPGYGALLDHLQAEKGARPFTQVTIVTDSLTINRVWHTSHSDWFVVPNEPTAEVMRRQGVPADKLRVDGFPTPAFFAEPREKSVPAPGAKWRVLFMVNSGKRVAVEAVRALRELDFLALTVTVGRDAALEAEIRELGGLEVFGWTSELPRLIAEAHVVVSKAGGATVQECLAAGTPMIVSQIVPGQEEGNARLIAEGGAGVVAVTPEAMVAAVRAAFAEEGRGWLAWRGAVSSLGRPGASAVIAQWMAAGCPAQADA